MAARSVRRQPPLKCYTGSAWPLHSAQGGRRSSWPEEGCPCAQSLVEVELSQGPHRELALLWVWTFTRALGMAVEVKRKSGGEEVHGDVEVCGASGQVTEQDPSHSDHTDPQEQQEEKVLLLWPLESL